MQRLSWNEIRARAAAFAEEWADATYEKGEAHSFWNEFFEIFGVRRRTVARYEEHVRRLDDTHGYIDLFWPGQLIVEQKSAGRSLIDAAVQAGTYFDALPEQDQPRRQIVCDFQTFELLDRETKETARFTLADLKENVERFRFVLGREARTFREQAPINVKAAERIGRLHDALEAAGYRGHDLERFLVRIVFCLFADDTGIFEPRDILWEYLRERTGEDGSDMGARLVHLFQVLDTPEGERAATLDEDLARFPYVNGALFKDALRIPSFDAGMRNALLDACAFDWTAISPAIFGSLFQSVMDRDARRRLGAHYTSEANILKAIEPLFLSDLRAEFKRIKVRRTQRARLLREFQEKLANLSFLDPACGCGNFLVIAYRELRQLEMEAILELRESGQLDLYAETLSLVDVSQMYGIEVEEFPARIAETALWMMDHLMNRTLSDALGKVYVRLPLRAAPHIAHGDALALDWGQVLPAADCNFVMGNPPFGGFVQRSKEARSAFHAALQSGNIKGKRVDYVAGWLAKASAYTAHNKIPISFVSTNSITQGEQVPQIWPPLFTAGLRLSFAYRTFNWKSEGRGTAAVHVVILGLDWRKNLTAELYEPSIGGKQFERSKVKHISPYLIDTGHLKTPETVIARRSSPISALPEMRKGTEVVEGGHLLFNTQEASEFRKQHPKAGTFLRPFWGGREWVRSLDRFLLDVSSMGVDILSLPVVKDRLTRVRRYRENGGSTAKMLASDPTRYHVNRSMSQDYIAFQALGSDRREYAIVGILPPEVIPSDQLRVLQSSDTGIFGLLSARTHTAWLKFVGGRYKSDPRYSAGMVYNTFPVPENADLSILIPHEQAVLDARSVHQDSTLARLYDPDLMPKNLREAHRALDRAVDRLYRRRPFSSDRERVEHLFSLYEKIVTSKKSKVRGRARGAA